MSTHVRLSEPAAQLMRELSEREEGTQTALIERALQCYARERRREHIRAMLEQTPWEPTDRVDALKSALGL